MKLILKLSIFLTFFLTLYFLLNLKPNPVTVVRARLKRLRDSLFNQLYVNKTSQERLKWILELEQRRDGIRIELKHNLKLNPRLEKIINSIIDNSWDELLGILKSGTEGAFFVQKPGKAAAKGASSGSADDIEEVEALEEIDDADSIGDAEEIAEADEIEEVEEVEEADEIEEAEAVEEIEDAEEVSEAEEISEADEIEEAEEVPDSQEPEEIEELDEYEEIAEAEEPNVIDIALHDALEPPKKKSKGLLGTANKLASEETSEHNGLLEAATKKVTASKGLLSKAGKAKEPPPPRSGLLALISKIEFDQDIKPSQDETLEYPVMDREDKEMLNNLDIVSPFSSMFSSLDDEK